MPKNKNIRFSHLKFCSKYDIQFIIMNQGGAKMNRTVERALTILQLIANSDNGITLQEIADKMAIAKSSAFVIVHTLLELNYIKTVINNDKKYCLGIESFKLGMKYLNDVSLVNQCACYLPALADKYAKTAFVGVLNDCEVVYLYKYVAPNARLATCAIGATKPAYATSLGKAILAFLPKGEQIALADKIEFYPYTSNTITTKDQLLVELDTIRQKGYSTERGELTEMTLCCGAPIFDYSGKVIASISLSDIDAGNEDECTMASDLLSVAENISKLLGYNPSTR